LLELPFPSEATNEQLEELRIVYVDLMSDKKSKSGDTYFEQMFRFLDEAESQPDAAVLILYTLEFPAMVYGSRMDVTGQARCKLTDTDFPLRLVLKRIGTDKRLGQWCRKAISTDESDRYNELILASSVKLLLSSSEQGPKGLDLILKHRRLTSFDDKFCALFEDLGKVVSREDNPPDTVINAILLLARVIREVKGEDHVQPTMAKFYDTPANRSMQRALEKIRSVVGESLYQFHRLILVKPEEISTKDIRSANSLPHRKGEARNVDSCAFSNCTKLGTKVCSRCKLVKYCGKSCQAADWHEHKRSCRKASSSNASSVEKMSHDINKAMEEARFKKSPSLVLQDTRLNQTPQVDYVLVLDRGDKDVGVCFSDLMGKLMFRILRQKAGEGSLYAVYRMYYFLESQVSSQQKNLLRRQLEAEYGIDPLSPRAMNDPRGKVVDEERTAALSGLEM
jgi:hypothetical protein